MTTINGKLFKCFTRQRNCAHTGVTDDMAQWIWRIFSYEWWKIRKSHSKQIHTHTHTPRHMSEIYHCSLLHTSCFHGHNNLIIILLLMGCHNWTHTMIVGHVRHSNKHRLYQQMPSCIVALLKALQSLGRYTHTSSWLMKVNNNYQTQTVQTFYTAIELYTQTSYRWSVIVKMWQSFFS